MLILYPEQSNSDDVIEELLQTLDAVRLRALINQYDRDYDDRLRENVTRILNKPYVAEDITKGNYFYVINRPLIFAFFPVIAAQFFGQSVTIV